MSLLGACVAPTGYPRIVESPSLKAVEKGRGTVMICEASGNPEPVISWLKDMVPVDMTDQRLQILPSGTSRRRSPLYVIVVFASAIDLNSSATFIFQRSTFVIPCHAVFLPSGVIRKFTAGFIHLLIEYHGCVKLTKDLAYFYQHKNKLAAGWLSAHVLPVHCTVQCSHF